MAKEIHEITSEILSDWEINASDSSWVEKIYNFLKWSLWKGHLLGRARLNQILAHELWSWKNIKNIDDISFVSKILTILSFWKIKLEDELKRKLRKYVWKGLKVIMSNQDIIFISEDKIILRYDNKTWKLIDENKIYIWMDILSPSHIRKQRVLYWERLNEYFHPDSKEHTDFIENISSILHSSTLTGANLPALRDILTYMNKKDSWLTEYEKIFIIRRFQVIFYHTLQNGFEIHNENDALVLWMVLQLLFWNNIFQKDKKIVEPGDKKSIHPMVDVVYDKFLFPVIIERIGDFLSVELEAIPFLWPIVKEVGKEVFFNNTKVRLSIDGKRLFIIKWLSRVIVAIDTHTWWSAKYTLPFDPLMLHQGIRKAIRQYTPNEIEIPVE